MTTKRLFRLGRIVVILGSSLGKVDIHTLGKSWLIPSREKKKKRSTGMEGWEIGSHQFLVSTTGGEVAALRADAARGAKNWLSQTWNMGPPAE